MSDVVTVYRAAWSTNCERVAIAFAHKRVEVDSVVIEYADRSPVEAISGQGLVPVIETGDGKVINDSVAIIRWLEEHNPEPGLFPSDPSRRAAVDVFIEWFERVYKLAPNLIEAELEKPEPDLGRAQALGAEMTARLDVFERLLGGGDHLLGDELGVADCIAYPFLKYAAGRDPADDEPFHRILEEHQPLGASHPRLAAWIERVGALPRAF